MPLDNLRIQDCIGITDVLDKGYAIRIEYHGNVYVNTYDIPILTTLEDIRCIAST